MAERKDSSDEEGVSTHRVSLGYQPTQKGTLLREGYQPVKRDANQSLQGNDIPPQGNLDDSNPPVGGSGLFASLRTDQDPLAVSFQKPKNASARDKE